uniref:Uncharacterized protein n=1 Tax=Aegilops tauschii subsp. strangulata TaxID=200361 RepID=A0A453PUJ3_AEGTS
SRNRPGAPTSSSPKPRAPRGTTPIPPAGLLSGKRRSRMAANFWTSSHSKQLLDPEEVDVVPAADRERGVTPVEFRLVKIHMSFHIWRLAQQVKVRQRLETLFFHFLNCTFVYTPSIPNYSSWF